MNCKFKNCGKSCRHCHHGKGNIDNPGSYYNSSCSCHMLHIMSTDNAITFSDSLWLEMSKIWLQKKCKKSHGKNKLLLMIYPTNDHKASKTETLDLCQKTP